MGKLLFKLILVLAVFSSLPSCSLTPDAMVLLDKSTSSYERAVRWGEFTRAKSFHKNAPVLSDLDRRRLKLYKVTAYETLQNETPDQHNSYLLVEVKYLKIDRQLVKSMTIKQHWKRDGESETWYLDTPFPKFR